MPLATAKPAQRAAGSDGRPGRLTESLLLLAVATAATPLYVNVYSHFTLRSTDLLVFLACVSWGLALLRGKAKPLLSTPVDVPLVALFAAIVASLSVAPHPFEWLKAARPWFLFGAAFWLLAAHLPDARAAGRVVLASLVGLVLQLAIGLAEMGLGQDRLRHLLLGPFGHVLYEPDVMNDRLKDFLFNWAMHADDPMRFVIGAYPSGTTFNSTVFSVVMAGLALVLVAYESHDRLRSRLAVALSVVAALVMLLSFKRSGWVAFGAGLPVLALAGRWGAVKRWLVPAGAIAAVFVALSLFVPKAGAQMVSRAESIGEEVEGTPVAGPAPASATVAAPNDRFALWHRGLEILAAHPLTGVGCGQWPSHGPWTPTRRGLIRWGNPESSVISLAAETGVFGVGGYLAMIALLVGLAVKLAWRGGDDAWVAAACAVGMTALAVGSCLDTSFTDDKSWPLFAAYAAATVALHRRARARSAAERQPTLMPRAQASSESAAAERVADRTGTGT